MISGTKKDTSMKQTKKKELDVIINEVGGTSFQNPILAGQWFAMKADVFILARLTNPRSIESQGKEKKTKKEKKRKAFNSPDFLRQNFGSFPFRKLILSSICYHNLADMMEINHTEAMQLFLRIFPQTNCK